MERTTFTPSLDTITEAPQENQQESYSLETITENSLETITENARRTALNLNQYAVPIVGMGIMTAVEVGAGGPVSYGTCVAMCTATCTPAAFPACIQGCIPLLSPFCP